MKIISMIFTTASDSLNFTHSLLMAFSDLEKRKHKHFFRKFMSSKRNSEKDLPGFEALDEVNKHIKDAFDILNRETKKLRKERNAFDEVAKKLENVHFSTMLKLNVGGHFFSTSLATMTKDPGSMFHSMFSGRFDTKPGEDGSYFIDRDGTHFRYILNYLRTGKLVLPDDKVVRMELLNEAEFYQIDGILDELKANPFKDSAILSSEQREILVDWLKDTRESLGDDYVLLYRASRNGWAASNFHSCCDNKGPTVTVIKYGNYIFGGYTEQSWQSSDTAPYKRAPGSFLFSLVNASGLPPTKMPLIDGKEGSAIYCHNSRGPVFGGGHDLCVPDSPNSSNCSVNLGITYRCPAGQNGNLFLTGSQHFVVNEMECNSKKDFPGDEALDKVNKHIKDAFDILKRETNRLRKERNAFDEVAKKLEHVHFSSMLKLNVGGHFFSTSLATMTKDPGSMLHAMFSGRFDTKPGEDGSYFIDRDGTHFRHILNYLRTGKLVLPNDKVVRKELLSEAEFYQIDGILDELKAKPFKDSAVLSSEQRETLVDWLKDTRESLGDDYVLLYRASRDGWSASNFHSCCDNKGPTVTVIKSGNYIFGGYTEQPWQSSISFYKLFTEARGVLLRNDDDSAKEKNLKSVRKCYLYNRFNTGLYKTAPGSFLFSLVNASGLPPTKLPLIDGMDGKAIFCYRNNGPVFGGGNDLNICCSSNSDNCSVSLGNSYQCPVGQNGYYFLTGSQDFTVNEMEVFVFQN
ncbi:unnamed protein product [Pocillopora meandrina]|uniref:BTB/POZ domain-containing protein KCTD6 n=1 Tax=Pocillopora meandrina TaxID=46732 RepID=A0AAU9WXX3_9CNID|nr:unnamed protein product [Pocillopora meandrina]